MKHADDDVIDSLWEEIPVSEIIENDRLTEREIDDLTMALKRSVPAFDKLVARYIGTFKSIDTDEMVMVYTDKNGLLTI